MILMIDSEKRSKPRIIVHQPSRMSGSLTWETMRRMSIAIEVGSNLSWNQVKNH